MRCEAIPFRAALFDLDGTLLDSTYVWHQVDQCFFANRGIPQAEDYARSIQGMSFREAAEYTVRRFNLPDTAEAVMDEWTQMTVEEYAQHVELKHGALDYLRMLKRNGVKLAVATVNRPEIFMSALERCGVRELFDVICTSAEVGDSGKSDGALFLFTAERLGVLPEDCAVFEDTFEGLAGARRAGMRAYAVRDVANEHSLAVIEGLADGLIEDYCEMQVYHAFEEPHRRCVIFTARCSGRPERAYMRQEEDFILCADRGWELARYMGVKPNLVIGDFDSSSEPVDMPSVRVPVEKDDTDTMLCLKKGLSMGFDVFWIVGGFGGRVDHTLANFQMLHYAAERGARATMYDGETWAAAVKEGTLCIPSDVLETDADGVKLSVFAMSDICRGVSIRGTKYTMEESDLSNTFPLGVSNEFASASAEIAVREGTLLVIVCRE